MLCRIEMLNHEAIFARFYRYRMLHGAGPGGGGGSKFTIIGLPIIVLLLSLFMWSAGVNNTLILIALALVAAYLLYILVLQPRSLYRKKSGAALETLVYLFTENGVTRSARSEEGGLPENTSMRYDGLVKVVETSKDFYLFTSQTQAYLVDKEYFTNGTPEELREMLRKEMGDKFKGPKR